jgi:hypothetical protein
MSVHAPFIIERSDKQPRKKLQLIFVLGCRIVKTWDNKHETLCDWCQDILFWRPGKGTNR